MFALRSKRTFASLLATALLSSQLIASLPGICSCTNFAAGIQERTCCTDSMVDSVVSQCCASHVEGSSCCCGNDCGETSTNCDCGCSSTANDERVPTEETNRILLEEEHCLSPVSSVTHLIQKKGCVFVYVADSCRIDRGSPQILFSVWQI